MENNIKEKRKLSLAQRMVAAVIFAAILAFFTVLWLHAADKIDIGSFTEPCGFKQRNDLPCPACGMTTSAIAFAKGHILKAFYIQPAGGLLCLLLLIIAFLALLSAVSGVYFSFFDVSVRRLKFRYILLALAIIIVAGWAVTLIRAI